jgi:hypothetical protein
MWLREIVQFTNVTSLASSACGQRLTSTGELRQYLRSRLSMRSGLLLVLDRYLFNGKTVEEVERIVEFLASFGRPIRALVTNNSAIATRLLQGKAGIEARKTSEKKFHDRLWIAGEIAVLVGTSVNQFLKEGAVPATSAVDLPHADAVAWRALFEDWWAAAQALQ